MAKSRIGAINQQFEARVLPTFFSWGMQHHPSELASFGRDEHGYHYSFADLREPLNIKLCSFHIFQKDGSVAIDCAKNLRTDLGDRYIPRLGTDPKMKTFRLARRLTLKRFFKDFLDASFRLEQRKGETVESAATRLIDDVIRELPRLKRYLYG